MFRKPAEEDMDVVRDHRGEGTYGTEWDGKCMADTEAASCLLAGKMAAGRGSKGMSKVTVSGRQVL